MTHSWISEVGLASIGRSRLCRGAASGLQMWRAGGGEDWGGRFPLTLSTSTLGSGEGVHATQPHPRGRQSSMGLRVWGPSHGSTHVNSTHSPGRSLAQEVTRPGGHSPGAWELQLFTPYSSHHGCACCQRAQTCSCWGRALSHKLWEPLSTLGQDSPLDLKSFHGPSQKGTHVFTLQVWECGP